MGTKKSVVIYGGSFNPPHNFHFVIAEQVLSQYEEVEKVVFTPVCDKYPKCGLIENEHRYKMLKIITDKNSNFMVSDVDMHESRSLPTIETLEKMQKQFPDKEIWSLMGSDNLKEIYKWDRAEQLVSKYKFIIMERDKDIMEEIIEKNELLKSNKENFKKLNPDIRSNLSSRYVRAQIKNSKSIKYLVPDEVYEYIEENELYR